MGPPRMSWILELLSNFEMAQQTPDGFSAFP